MIWINSLFSNYMFISLFHSFLHLHLNTALSIISFILQCVYLLIYFYFVVKLFILVYSYIPEENNELSIIKFNYLIQSLDLNKLRNRLFWFVFETRKIISLAFVIFIENKIAATCLLIGINLSFFIYLYFSNPFLIRH